MNNGFGTGCYFSANVSQSAISGSIKDFKLKKSADKSEITDNSNNFLQIAFSKRKKVANVEVLIQGSGSLIAVPDIGNTASLGSPWTNEVTGSWGVTDSEITLKSDDFVTVSVELTQWYKSDGTTLP